MRGGEGVHERRVNLCFFGRQKPELPSTKSSGVSLIIMGESGVVDETGKLDNKVACEET